MADDPANVRDLTETHWDALVRKIKSGKCTPILGAGASYPSLPLAPQLAQRLAEANEYPFLPQFVNGDPNKPVGGLDLAEVAQFIAVKSDDWTFPKEQIRDLFKQVPPPDFSKLDEPYGILANLDLSVYITTNYDDFMFQALQRQGKKPERAVCLWNDQIGEEWSIFKEDITYKPSPETPVVFHLHGHIDSPESMVLTEDDYLDFLVKISQEPKLLPSDIAAALAINSLLVIGYGLKDWNFRVLLRGIMATVKSSQRPLSVTVQFPPDDRAIERMDYLTKYYHKFYSFTACWDSASEFAKRLGSKL